MPVGLPISVVTITQVLIPRPHPPSARFPISGRSAASITSVVRPSPRGVTLAGPAGARQLPRRHRFAAALIAHGRPPDTPVAVVALRSRVLRWSES